MAKALGVGGVFFKSPDPQKLNQWYTDWLGFDITQGPGVTFKPQAIPPGGLTVWSVMDAATDYFAPADRPFMINLMVDDLGEALAQVSRGGAQIVGEIESYDYGRFGWFLDPDGNKVELWEPRQP